MIKGTVVEVTDHEIVFTDRYVLKASKAGGAKKKVAVKAYLDSDNKQSLLERSIITQDVSYSRAHMSAIKLAELKDQVILVEAKGRFRDAMDAKRYINIRQALPVDVELVFLFQRPSEPMPRRSRRLDGTRFSVADWAEKHDFKWYSALTFPRRWLKKR